MPPACGIATTARTGPARCPAWRRICWQAVVLMLLMQICVADAAAAGWTAAALARMPFSGQATVVDDRQAAEGKALRILAAGDGGVLTLQPADVPAGRCRITVRARRGEGLTGRLRVAFWTARDAPQPFRSEGELDLAGLPVQGFGDLACELPVRQSAGVQAALFGVCPGLVVESVSLAPGRQAPPVVEVLSVNLEQLRYPLRAVGRAHVLLRNTTTTAQSITLRIRVESGLQTTSAIIYNTVTVPAGADRHEIAILLPPPPEFGHCVIAEAAQYEQVLSRKSAYFFASDRPEQIGQLGRITLENDGWETADAQIARCRAALCPLLEVDDWTPCPAGMPAQEGLERWRTARGSRRSSEQLNTYLRRAHEQGMAVLGGVSFAGLSGCDDPELARAHPEWVEWGPDDVHRVITGNPLALRWQTTELLALRERIGWDGFRYHDTAPYDRPQVDILGRKTPFAGWSNTVLTTWLRTHLQEGHAVFIFGHEVEPELEMNPDPLQPRKAGYAEVLRDGGVGFCDPLRDALLGRWSWQQWTDYTVRAGANALWHGGALYLALEPSPDAVETDYLAITALAAGLHLAGPPAPSSLLTFAGRYCDLLYAGNRHPLCAPDAVLRVDSGGRELWWRNYICRRQTAPGRRVYYVHLINPPAAAQLGVGNTALPAPVTGVALQWTFPAGWRPVKAYHLTPDDEAWEETTAFENNLLLTRAGLTLRPACTTLPMDDGRVTVPVVRRWSVVAVECEGPADEIDLPERLPLPPLPPVPDPAAPITAEMAQYQRPAAFSPLRFTAVELAASGFPGSVLMNDANAAGGKVLAVRAAGEGLPLCNIGSPPAGRYRCVLRMDGVPVNLTLEAESKAENPKPFRVVTPLRPLPGEASGGYRLYAGEVELGDAVTGGVDLRLRPAAAGLLVDTLAIEQVEAFPDSRRLAWQPGPAWPKRPPARPAGEGTRIWFACREPAETYRIAEALGLVLGARVDVGKPPVSGSVEWGGVPFPATPQALMRYRMVVLGNIPLSTLTIDQRAWLCGYVEAGGRLLLLGGPYAFGNGGWQESDLLEEMLPVIPAPYDLQPVGEKTPVPLAPASDLARAFDWKTPPVLIWQHLVEVKPDAVVHVTAGGHPIIVSRRTGAGAVTAILAVPCGTPPASTLAFWEWPDWPRLVAALAG